MKVSFIKPRPELARCIQSIWTFESDVGLPLSDGTVVAPTGNPKLILSCDNNIISHADGVVQEYRDQDLYLLGVRDVPVSLHTRRAKTCFIGIEFHPQGAYPILRVPMFELTNRLAPLAELVSSWRTAITELVPSLSSIEAKADFVQELLCREIAVESPGNPVIDYCVAAIRERAGLLSISALEEQTGYSRRYLEMLFKRHVGITPKNLARIFRFQRLYRQWSEARPYEEIIDQLYESYYDQAHFAKDFKRMTGFSPRQFMQSVPNRFGRQMALR